MNGTITLESKLGGEITMANTIINGGASPYPKGASGSIITITDGAENTPLKSAIVNIEPVQSGSGDPSPTNIRPISGWTQATVNRTGGNLMPGFDSGLWGTADTTGWTISNFSSTPASFPFDMSAGKHTGVPAIKVYLKGGVEYSISASPGKYWCISYYDESDNKISNGASGWGIGAFTPPVGTAYAIFGISNYQGTATTLTVSTQVQIALGSSLPAWTAYKGTTHITIILGRTVYGGTVDALQGEGESGYGTYNLKSHNQSYITQYDYNGKHGVMINYALPSTQSRAVGWCDTAPVSTEANYNSNQYMWFGVNSTAIFWIGILDALGTDLAGFKTWLAAHDVTICRPLASPTIFSVTPQTIKTLLGTNDIWADAGEMSIEYYPAAASIVAVQNRSTKAYVSIPLGMIRYETYQITPQQTIDLDSYRSENGNLLRNPVATKCKLEFNTPLMTDTQWAEIWNIIKAGFNNNTERKLKLKYYDTLSATYKTGYFYVPDVQTTIRNIEEAEGVINYQEIRLAFIEY